MRRRRFLTLLVLAPFLAVLTHFYWLPWFGEFLVRTDAIEKADAVLVLAGDYSGRRLIKGAELVREGHAPIALVSGPWVMYGRNEAHLAIDFALSKGFPKELFRPVLHQSDSTAEEAIAFRKVFREEGMRKVLIVTSDFHTRRAGAIFRRTIPDVAIRMIAAPSAGYQPATWWTSRASRKVFFQEWIKTLADWLGI